MANPNLEKYRINGLSDDADIVPEETLIDSISAHSAIEMPMESHFFGFFSVAVILVFVFFIVQSFKLQIIEGDRFALLAQGAAGSNITLSPLRGIIFDSEGRPMVRNIPAYDLVAVMKFLPDSETEIRSLVDGISEVTGVSSSDLLGIFQKNNDRAVFTLKENLTKEEIIKINELNNRGVYAVVNVRREYFDGQTSAHLLGYTSMVTREEIDNDIFYYINDRIGRLGIEAGYEEYLRGEHRIFDFENQDNQNWENFADDVFININKDIQKKLYESMQNVFVPSGVRRGAAIVQNPKTGAVLGIVSLPSFDNNLFEQSSEEANSAKISRILNSSDTPLLNRVIGGRYSPGSTIKPLLALAGLEEGIVAPSTIIYADGSISIQSEVDPNHFFVFRDWKVHGWTDIRKAISDSVDVYFYALGGGYKNIDGLGIDKIAEYFRIFRMDKLTGIDLPGEISGFFPTREWKQEARGERWYKGDTYNISIGQGDLVATPVWLNMYVGAIANGGKLMKPNIVNEIKDRQGNIIKSTAPEILGEIPFDQETLDIVKEGMRQTVLSGTATILNDVPVTLAAKTGTAQTTGENLNSLFTVFGPYDDPEIVMTVLVENIKESQGLAIRVAKEFLTWYFSESSNN